MVRTVDTGRRRARRDEIIAAAYECFAELGYGRATTAAICKHAGVSSGTFFHYFPTKLEVLLAVLAHGTDETRRHLAGYEHRTDAREVVLDYLTHAANQAADPHLPGFVRAVSGLVGHPDVDRAVREDDKVVQEFLHRWIGSAQRAGQVRSDWPADLLGTWVGVLLEGFLGRSALDPDFAAGDQAAALVEVAARMIDP
ncbi:MAG TPA: TetR/AcrR family transcriptional regulator [Euzebyales bacterium]|nr:TetR/AcrR family transcriptional regulator [Euzebyales bacterium]